MPFALLTFLSASPWMCSDWTSSTTAVLTFDRAAMLALPQRVSIQGAPEIKSLDGLEGLAFDGSSDALVAECNPVCGAEGFAVEMLIAPAIGGPEEQRFMHIEDEAGRRLLLELRMVGPDQWTLDTFLFDGGENRRTLIDRTKVHPAGRWHWVALRYDGTTMSHFVDGVRECEATIAVPVFGEGRVSIGARLNRVSWFQGLIREVRIHRLALDPAELQRRQSGSESDIAAAPR